MKRLAQRAMTVSLVAIGTLSVAIPAYAAESSGDSPVTGGAGGLLMGLILGVLVGLIIFVDVFTGDGPEEMPELPREH